MTVVYSIIRDIVSTGAISVEKVPCAENPVDMMTKSLVVSKFKHCLDLISLYSL